MDFFDAEEGEEPERELEGHENAMDRFQMEEERATEEVHAETFYECSGLEGGRQFLTRKIPPTYEARRRLTDLTIECQKQGRNPLRWTSSTGICLPKDGSDGSPAKFRVIHLIDAMCKILYTALQVVPGAWIDREIPTQTGFARGTSTLENIGMALTDIWRAFKQKLPWAMLAEDVEGAFDKTSRGGMR